MHGRILLSFSLGLVASFSAYASDLSPAEERMMNLAKEIHARSPRCNRAFQDRVRQAAAKSPGGETGFKSESDVVKVLGVLKGSGKLAPTSAVQFADFAVSKSGELKHPKLLPELVLVRCAGLPQSQTLRRVLADGYGLLKKNPGLVRQVATRVREEVTEASGNFDALVLIAQVGLMQNALERGLFKAPDSALRDLKALRTRLFLDYKRLNGEFTKHFGAGGNLEPKAAAAALKANLDLIRMARSGRKDFEKILAALG